MTLTETAWTPPLSDLPPSVGILLKGVRFQFRDWRSISRQAPTEQTPDVAASLPLDDNGRAASFRLRGYDTGGRNSALGMLDFSLVGEAMVDDGAFPLPVNARSILPHSLCWM